MFFNVSLDNLQVMMNGVAHQDSVLDQLRHLRLDLFEVRSSDQILRSHSGDLRPVVRHLNMAEIISL